MYVPQTAVRKGFLLSARELGRSRKARPGKQPGARFVPERKKHSKRNAVFVTEHKNTVNVMLSLSPSTKAQ